MNSWCESCARKNLCYVVDDRPKCFVPITNTASGTPYLVGISSISRDNHEIAKDEPQTCDEDDIGNCNICKYVGLEHRCNQCVNGSHFYKVKDEPQTERSE